MQLAGGLVGFVIAAVIARWAMPRFDQLAWWLGAVAEPSARGIHSGVVPLSGGLTILASITLAVVATGWAGVHASGWIVVPALLMGAVGLVDDVVELRWVHKLALQMAVIALALWLDGHAGANARDAARFAWLLVVTNAMNFIDNMDGLASGTAALALLALAVVAGSIALAPAGYMALIVAGAAVGFFGPNYARGAAFLGDSGSLVLGFVAAAVSLAILERGGRALPCVLPLAYPVIDLAFVIVSRCMRGRHPIVGGPDHTSHRLSRRLASPKRAVAVLLVGSLVCGAASGVLACA